MTPEESMGPATAAPAAAPPASKTSPLAALIAMIADRFTVLSLRSLACGQPVISNWASLPPACLLRVLPSPVPLITGTLRLGEGGRYKGKPLISKSRRDIRRNGAKISRVTWCGFRQPGRTEHADHARNSQ